MTRDEAAKNIRAMRAYRRKVTSSRTAAIKALKDAGILTDDGRLADPYRVRDEIIEDLT
jgi:hypothetical protein